MTRLVIIAASTARAVPAAGDLVRAEDAYTRWPYERRRDYARRFADAWLIFSAKWGLLAPSQLIDPSYVAYGIEADEALLVRQLRENGADRYDVIEVLAGEKYLALLRAPARTIGLRLAAPLRGRGLRMGEQSVEINKCLKRGEPFPA